MEIRAEQASDWRLSRNTTPSVSTLIRAGWRPSKYKVSYRRRCRISLHSLPPLNMPTSHSMPPSPVSSSKMHTKVLHRSFFDSFPLSNLNSTHLAHSLICPLKSYGTSYSSATMPSTSRTYAGKRVTFIRWTFSDWPLSSVQSRVAGDPSL